MGWRHGLQSMRRSGLPQALPLQPGQLKRVLLVTFDLRRFWSLPPVTVTMPGCVACADQRSTKLTVLWATSSAQTRANNPSGPM